MIKKVNSNELLMYFIVWISINLYSLIKLYLSQTDILKDEKIKNTLTNLQPGWSFLSRPIDESDLEWNCWKYFINTSRVYLIFQLLISEAIRYSELPILKLWYIVSSITFICFHMGFHQLLIVVVQPVAYTILIYFKGKKLSIWVVSVLLLISNNSLKYSYFYWDFFDHDNLQDEEVYLILNGVAWIELRCISFCIDYVDQKEDDNSKTFLSIMINLFSFVLYLPLLFTGPVVLYEDFKQSFRNRSSSLSTRIKTFLCNMIIFMVYTFMLDLVFHYIYFLAMRDNLKSIKKLHPLALCGGGLFMGLEFHLKYAISYGTTSEFARLDNINAPPIPRCIARIHVYSDMWKYFDVGLYKFLIRYIHIPTTHLVTTYLKLKNTTGKLTASLVTFAFIFIWHGTTQDILIWSILNYTGIALENLGQSISKTSIYMKFKVQVLKSEEMEARFIAFVCTPLLCMSCISNFYLFAGQNVADLFFECFFQPSLWYSMIIFGSLYTGCHVSMALRDVPSRTAKKKE